MSVTVTDRPVLEVTRRGEHAWPRTQANHHAVRRTYYPARGSVGAAEARFKFDRCMPIPELGIVTLVPSPPTPMQNMVKAAWSFAGPSNASSYWFEVRTEATGQTWLKGNFTSSAGGFTLTTTQSFNWGPGILFRMRSYAPYYSASASEVASYVKLSLTDGIGAGASTWFQLLLLRTGHLDSAGDVVDMPGIYVAEAGTDWRWVTAIDVTPGVDLGWTIRRLLDYAVISGSGIEGHYCLPLTTGVRPQHGTVTVYVGGAGMLFHLSELRYGHTYGQVLRTTAAAIPPHCNMPTTFDALYYPEPGTSAAAASGEVELTGSALRSPLVVGWTESAAGTLNSATENVVTVPQCEVAEIELDKSGRGQRARLRFVDDDGSLTSGFQVGEVVRVTGKWGADVSAVTLFQGRVAAPNQWRKDEEGTVSGPYIVLEDDAALLERKTALALDGSFAGITIAEAVTAIANAAEIEASRLTLPSSSARLQPEHPYGLAWTDPDSTLLDVLDGVVKASGNVWRFLANGGLEVADPSTLGIARGTLDDSNAALATHIVEVEFEKALSAEYANAVYLRDPETGHDTVYAPDPSAWPKSLIWVVDESPGAEAVLRARRIYDERRREDQFLSWTQWVDFAAMPLPWDTYTTGTIAYANVPSGKTVCIERARYYVDCGTAGGTALVHLLGKVVD